MKAQIDGVKIGLVYMLFILTVAVLLSACGSQGPGGGENGTGSVAVLFTDGPTEEFSEINVTVNEIKLISDDHPPAVLFDGSRRIDLLSLQEDDNLFMVHESVPAGIYSKIRLRISDPEFVKKTGGTISSDQIHLVANGKLDLVLKKGVFIGPGETLVLRLDLDAEKSVHIHLTGSGIYKLRPVVFVEVINGLDSLFRFVSLKGVIESIDPGEHSFILRRDHPLINGSEEDGHSEDESLSNDKFTSDDSFPHEDDPNGLIRIAVGEETDIFQPVGPPGDFESLEVGQPVSVRGFLTRDENRDLFIRAKLIQLGDVLRLRGTVTEMLNDQNQFGFNPDDGEEVTRELLVQLYDETRIFEARTHRELNGKDLVPGLRIILEGVPDSFVDLFYSSLIIVKPVSSVPKELEGNVQDLNVEERTFNLLFEGPLNCLWTEGCLSAGDVVPVFVLPDALILRLNEAEAVEKSKPLGVEIISIDALKNGTHVHLFGEFSGEAPERFEAKVVLAVIGE